MLPAPSLRADRAGSTADNSLRKRGRKGIRPRLAFISSVSDGSRLTMDVALHKTGRQTQLNAVLMQVYCTEPAAAVVLRNRAFRQLSEGCQPATVGPRIRAFEEELGRYGAHERTRRARRAIFPPPLSAIWSGELSQLRRLAVGGVSWRPEPAYALRRQVHDVLGEPRRASCLPFTTLGMVELSGGGRSRVVEPTVESRHDFVLCVVLQLIRTMDDTENRPA